MERISTDSPFKKKDCDLSNLMRILQIFYRFNRGGTERLIDTLTREWMACGHEVWIWLPAGGIPPMDLPILRGTAFPYWCRGDVLVVHGGLMGTKDYGLSVNKIESPIVEVLHRRATAQPGANSYVAVSESVAKFQRYVSCTVIPNGVRIPPPRRSREDVRRILGVEDNTIIIFRHGRIAIEKGWHWTMKIMEEVWENGLPSILVVCGVDDGFTSTILKKWGRDKPCLLFKWKENPADLIIGADIYLETSPVEAFGLAPAEAASLGVPVVSFKVPGIEETLGDSALMVPEGDIRAVARALSELCENRKLRKEIGLKTRQRIQKLFDPKVCAFRYMSLFEELINNQQ